MTQNRRERMKDARSVTHERGHALAQRVRQLPKRGNGGKDVVVLVPREHRLGDAAAAAQLGLADLGFVACVTEAFAECLSGRLLGLRRVQGTLWACVSISHFPASLSFFITKNGNEQPWFPKFYVPRGVPRGRQQLLAQESGGG